MKAPYGSMLGAELLCLLLPSAPELSAYLLVVGSSCLFFVLSWGEMGLFSTAAFSQHLLIAER